MITFNELGTKFAELEDAAKAQLTAIEAARADALQGFDKHTANLRNFLDNSFQVRIDAIKESLGYPDGGAAETDQQDAAKAA